MIFESEKDVRQDTLPSGPKNRDQNQQVQSQKILIVLMLSGCLKKKEEKE